MTNGKPFDANVAVELKLAVFATAHLGPQRFVTPVDLIDCVDRKIGIQADGIHVGTDPRTGFGRQEFEKDGAEG